MKSIPVILVAIVCASSLPAGSQSYQYSYGTSRVVNQGQNGLANPSSSYIGPGTVSQSARGLPAGVSSGGMSGLPQTKMGAHVGTPGDNQYSYAVQSERLYGKRVIGRNRQNGNQQWNNANPDLHYYVPGQNGGAIKQGQFVAPRYGGGTATYAEADHYNVGKNGAFHY